jgi:hypothetical protein
MLVFRWLVMLLLLAGVLSFGMFVATGQPRWRAFALGILKWTIVAALGFFGVLILERMVMIL